jgi:hypothetical protein
MRRRISRECTGTRLLGTVGRGSGSGSNSRLHVCQLVDQSTEHVVLREQVLLDLHCLMEHGIGIVVSRLGTLVDVAPFAVEVQRWSQLIQAAA